MKTNLRNTVFLNNHKIKVFRKENTQIGLGYKLFVTSKLLSKIE